MKLPVFVIVVDDGVDFAVVVVVQFSVYTAFEGRKQICYLPYSKKFASNASNQITYWPPC